MRKYVFLFLIILSVFSCENENKTEAEIAKIEVDFNIERFDIAFSKASPSELPELKREFPFMFSSKFDDTFWEQQMKDTLQMQLRGETQKVFEDFSTEKHEMEQLFQHLKYYFPNFKTPRIITATSSVDYRNKVIVTDTIALISLDTYLGKDHFFYEGMQNYIKQDLTRELLVVDMANQYAEKNVYQSKRKNLLQEMIYFGKKLYFLDKVIPFKTEAERISYSPQELDWAKANEEYIWRYFVDREMLYSTDSKLPSRFINPAPFSKFYLEEIDADSPDRLGQFIGWQIVKSYMKNNDVSFEDLLSKSAEDIFNKSKYKPRR